MMKKLKKVILVALISILYYSCDNTKDIPSPNNLEVSEIDLIEKEMGVALFKKDISISDISGNNSITLRFAAKNEEILADYLSLYSYSLMPIFSLDYTQNPENTMLTSNNINENNSNLYSENILSEVLSKNLEKNAIGFSVKVEYNHNNENARIASYAYTTEHISYQYPIRCRVGVNSSGTPIPGGNMVEATFGTIGCKFMSRSRWISGYSTRTYCLYENGVKTICQTNWTLTGEHIGQPKPWPWYKYYDFKIDPCYRAKIIVYHNYGGFAGGEYLINWY